MSQANELLIGAGPDGQPVGQAWRLANRHGLIAGATGTGKTVTLQHLAESFSDAGVAVFAADIKGDLCGIAAPGNPQGKVAERIASMPWLNYQPKAYPTTLWDIAGKTGHPLRTTISEMGPLLLANLLELTDSQQAALFAAFQVADREGLLLLDLKDLKALLNHLKDNPEILGEDRALFTGASGQALLRRLATLEQQGAEAFFGEPALQLEDILRPEPDGRGRIHLLDASRLVHEAPKVYATFLLWLLAEAVRATAGARRCRQAGAGTVLRRGPPAVQRHAESLARPPGTGGPADPLERRRGVLRHPVAGRPAGRCPGPGSACVSSMACAPSPPRSRNRCARWPTVSARTRRSTPWGC